MNLWIGCVAGALSQEEYLSKLQAAGFEQAAIEVTRVYSVEDAQEFLAQEGEEIQQLAAQVIEKFVSGFVRATKHVCIVAAVAGERESSAETSRQSCCAPGCCGN